MRNDVVEESIERRLLLQLRQVGGVHAHQDGPSARPPHPRRQSAHARPASGVQGRDALGGFPGEQAVDEGRRGRTSADSGTTSRPEAATAQPEARPGAQAGAVACRHAGLGTRAAPRSRATRPLPSTAAWRVRRRTGPGATGAHNAGSGPGAFDASGWPEHGDPEERVPCRDVLQQHRREPAASIELRQQPGVVEQALGELGLRLSGRHTIRPRGGGHRVADRGGLRAHQHAELATRGEVLEGPEAREQQGDDQAQHRHAPAAPGWAAPRGHHSPARPRSVSTARNRRT